MSIVAIQPAPAQRLHFGFVGGTGLTSNFPAFRASGLENSQSQLTVDRMSGPRSFIAGLQVEAEIHGPLSLDFNALRRPMQATSIATMTFQNGLAFTSRSTSRAVTAWEFPMLLKYTLPPVAGRFQPFVEAGPSFRTQEDSLGAEPSHTGISGGVGISIQVSRFRIGPTLRYARWSKESLYPQLGTKSDQLEFLTSISYATDGASRRFAGRKLWLGGLIGTGLADGFTQARVGPEARDRQNYLVGVRTEMGVAGPVSVEADGIYKPLRATFGSPFQVLTWQFPVLAKYRWSVAGMAPFVEAGPSFRLAGNLNDYDPSHVGVTAGAGLEKEWGGLRWAPALRFTHWATDSRMGAARNRTNPNAVELLVGFAF